VVAKKLSVRETEKLVTHHAAGRQQTLLRVKNDKPRDLLRLEEELSDLLASTVEIRVLKKGKQHQSGELAIAFGSLDALQGLIERLRGPQ
jgi:ParB family chromosome partitioning protein